MTRAVQELTDEALVRSARGGDDPAITELVARYLPMIRRRASRYFLPGMEAELPFSSSSCSAMMISSSGLTDCSLGLPSRASRGEESFLLTLSTFGTIIG